jgi:hypothetical protein
MYFVFQFIGLRQIAQFLAICDFHYTFFVFASYAEGTVMMRFEMSITS